MFSMFCCVAVRPAIRCAGSPPGMTTKIRKTMKLTAISTSTMPRRRRIRKANTLVLDPDLRARIERVTEAVAEDVQGEHGEHDRDTGRDGQPRGRLDPVLPLR